MTEMLQVLSLSCQLSNGNVNTLKLFPGAFLGAVQHQKSKKKIILQKKNLYKIMYMKKN